MQKSIKKQKGITLISLIITIILMLILVGLTISVALNGGLFNTADDATTKTEKHVIYDQIVGAMQLTNNGKIIVDETYGKVVEMYGAGKVTPINTETVDDTTTEVTFKVTGKKGTYEYKITGTEIIIGPINNDLKNLQTTFINKTFNDIWVEESAASKIVSEGIEMMFLGTDPELGENYGIFEYNGKQYMVVLNNENPQKISELYEYNS